MLKLLGSCLVVLGCGYWGWLKTAELKEKVQITREFIQALEFMKREIVQKKRKLPELLKKLSIKNKNQVGEYFRGLLQSLTAEEGELQVADWGFFMKKETGLSGELEKILAPLSTVLGRYDAQSQGEAITTILEELARLKLKQEQESENLIRVYATLGVTVGFFLAILLI